MNDKLPRREFVTSMLASGFALAVQPVMAQSQVKTDAAGLVAGEVKIPVADGSFPAYRAQPAGNGPFPVVLVVQEIFGVHEYIRDVCRRLARMGYMAVAPELFARQGDPAWLTDIKEIMNNIVAKVPDTQVMSDLDATVAWAGANGGDKARVGITGFCWGGRITWMYVAHNPALKAGVAWYGRLNSPRAPLTPTYPLDVAAKVKAPVLGLYGGLDAGIPMADVELMKEALKKANSRSTIHVYADAPHAFHADYRPSYRKEAAEDGWQRLTAWFKDNL